MDILLSAIISGWLVAKLVGFFDGDEIGVMSIEEQKKREINDVFSEV